MGGNICNLKEKENIKRPFNSLQLNYLSFKRPQLHRYYLKVENFKKKHQVVSQELQSRLKTKRNKNLTSKIPSSD